MRNIITSFIFYIFFVSCAQRVPPSGGKKDIISPKLVRSIPASQTKNFKAKTIELTFDEYIKLDNIQQQLLITPTIEGTYTAKLKNMVVKIVFDKEFKDSTTYSLNFRSSFRDISEGNEAKNIRVVFSTGSNIDSMKINGKVIDPLTALPQVDALVGLYKLTDTLNIRKEKPYYFTKTDTLGKFSIENISADKYKIFAIIDNNNNTLFNEFTEKIGYIKDTLNINKAIDGIELLVVKQEILPVKIAKNRGSVNYNTVELNKGIKEAVVTFLDTNKTIPYLLINKKEIKFFNTKNISDTIKVAITITDSTNLVSAINHKFIFKKPLRKTDSVKEEFKIEIKPKENESIENIEKYIFEFNKPIVKFDLNKVRFLEDTIKLVAITEKDIFWNNTKNQVTFSINGKSRKTLRLKIEKDAFFSVENDTLKQLKHENRLKNEEENGTISGEIINGNGKEIVQLLDTKYSLVSEIFYQQKYKFKLVPPGKYFLRMIADVNKNGQWDAGNLEKGIFPEKVQLILKEVQSKANFDLTGYDFNLKK